MQTPRHPLAKVYCPDSEFNPQGMVVLLGVMIAAGLVLGGLTAYIGQWIYLLILFPVLAGLGLGVVGIVVVEKFKLRHVPAVVLCGVIGGACWFTGIRYGEMLMARAEVEGFAAKEELKPVFELAEKSEEERKSTLESVEDPELRKGVESLLSTIDASRSLDKFVHWKLALGMSISKAGHSTGGIALGPTGTLITWLVELAFMAGSAIAMLYAQARKPFCRESQDWKTEHHFTFTGDSAPTAEIFRGADFKALAGVPFGGPVTHGIKIYLSPRSGSGATVDVFLYRLKSSWFSKKPTEKQIEFWSFDREMRGAVEEFIASRVQPAKMA